MSTLEQLVVAAEADFLAAADPAALENAKAKYLGKTGQITEQMKGLGKLDPDARRAQGAVINAAKMYYDQVNKEGGVHGRKIELVIEDDRCNANDLLAAVKKLTEQDKVFALNGGSCSGPVVKDRKVLTNMSMNALVVGGSNPARNLASFVDAAKRPGAPPLRYFSPGNGTSQHLSAVLLGQLDGAEIEDRGVARGRLGGAQRGPPHSRASASLAARSPLSTAPSR